MYKMDLRDLVWVVLSHERVCISKDMIGVGW